MTYSKYYRLLYQDCPLLCWLRFISEHERSLWQFYSLKILPLHNGTQPVSCLSVIFSLGYGILNTSLWGGSLRKEKVIQHRGGEGCLWGAGYCSKGSYSIEESVRIGLSLVEKFATRLYPQKDWAGWQFCVYTDMCGEAPLDERHTTGGEAHHWGEWGGGGWSTMFQVHMLGFRWNPEGYLRWVKMMSLWRLKRSIENWVFFSHLFILFSLFSNLSLSLSLVRIPSHVWCFGLSATHTTGGEAHHRGWSTPPGVKHTTGGEAHHWRWSTPLGVKHRLWRNNLLLIPLKDRQTPTGRLTVFCCFAHRKWRLFGSRRPAKSEEVQAQARNDPDEFERHRSDSESWVKIDHDHDYKV